MSLHIQSVSASNYKNLEIPKINLKPVTLVMGENGIGKSNFLQLIDAIVCGKDPVDEETGMQFAIDGRISDDDLVRRGMEEGDASITFAMGHEEYDQLAKAFKAELEGASGQHITISVAFRKDDGTVFRTTGIELSGVTIYSSQKGGPIPSQNALPVLHEWIERHVVDCALYIPTNRILHRQNVPFAADRDPDPVEDLENTILRLLSDKRQDAAIIDQILATLDQFFKITDIRSELATTQHPDPETLATPERDYRDSLGRPLRDLRVGIRLREQSKQWFDLHHVGTGIQQLLVIISMIHARRARIALIEEFDSSLSPRNRKELLNHLTDMAGRSQPLAQVITTTHGAFRIPDKRPAAICPTKPNEGIIGFKAADKNFWKDHILQEHDA